MNNFSKEKEMEAEKCKCRNDFDDFCDCCGKDLNIIEQLMEWDFGR